MDNRLLELISPWRWMPRMLGMPGLPRSSGQVCRAMPKVSEQCRPRCQSGIPANTPPPDSPPPVAVVTEPNGIKCKWQLKFFKLSGQHSTCFHCGTFVIKKIRIHTKTHLSLFDINSRWCHLSLSCPFSKIAIFF